MVVTDEIESEKLTQEAMIAYQQSNDIPQDLHTTAELQASVEHSACVNNTDSPSDKVERYVFLACFKIFYQLFTIIAIGSSLFMRMGK